MARQIDTRMEINAPADRVWRILTDFPAMPSWNPFIRSISGELRQGSRLSVHIAPPGRTGMRFAPKILVLEPERELRWLGRLLIPRLFDGEHYFILDNIDERRTLLTHGQTFSGILVGLFGGGLEATKGGFMAMNHALKQRAERT